MYTVPAIEVLTPAAAEPVTLAEFKNHLRYNLGSAEDALLAAFLKTAREVFELNARRPVISTQYRQWLPSLGGPVDLRRGPLLGVQAVKYYPADGGALATLTGWSLDSAELPAVLYLADGSYPALSTTRRRPAYVDYTAGWADASAVPAAVKTAITLLAAHYYKNREAYTDSALEQRTVPMGFRAVCDLFSTGLNWGA